MLSNACDTLYLNPARLRAKLAAKHGQFISVISTFGFVNKVYLG
jgi:hypothetical protein